MPSSTRSSAGRGGSKRGTKKKTTKRAKTTKAKSVKAKTAKPAASKVETTPVNKYFELRESTIQGRGGFAIRPIRKGTRIIEYLGERISPKEADNRYDDGKMGRHHTFLFSVDSKTVIDAGVDGNEARFINHSCAPNCEAIDERKRIFVEAIRNIAAGEELTYDYAYERDGTEDEDWERIYMCKCGAPTCRGTILAPPKKRAKK
ncbi:MAG TPA: SET domain-containing protein-lysine N-methyltransferase [Gemmatimonadaceae bacterium]|nr:SET domain-containing protein-lysine N-methyltransferase [Gemmatimonadaceae bacterium]